MFIEAVQVQPPMQTLFWLVIQSLWEGMRDVTQSLWKRKIVW